VPWNTLSDLHSLLAPDGPTGHCGPTAPLDQSMPVACMRPALGHSAGPHRWPRPLRRLEFASRAAEFVPIRALSLFK
jgi:hypothetical protein